jgi:hypothetical protein
LRSGCAAAKRFSEQQFYGGQQQGEILSVQVDTLLGDECEQENGMPKIWSIAARLLALNRGRVQVLTGIER